jgi:hypothetical protein
MNACKTLRSAVLISVGLLASGLLVLGLSEWVSTALPMAAPAAYLALWLVLGAIVTLIAALAVAAWPGQSLEGCIH